MRELNKSLFFLIIIDLFSFYTSLSLAYWTRKFFSVFVHIKFDFSFLHFLKLWWLLLIYFFFINYERLYTRRLNFWDEIRELIKAITISIIVIFAIVSLGKLSGQMSRLTIIFLWFYSLFVFPCFRYIGKIFLNKIKIWEENILIIGAGNAGKAVAREIEKDPYLGYKIVGFLDDSPEKIGRSLKINSSTYKVLGKIEDFVRISKETRTQKVIIAIPSMSRDSLCKLVNFIQKHAKEVFIIPDIKGISLLNSELQYLFMEQIFLIKIKNNLKNFINQCIKRIFDLTLIFLSMPVTILIIGIISILIKLDSGGPVFFIQERLGKDGTLFKCIKFRTMYVNANEILETYLQENFKAQEEWEKYKKLKDYDPRVTKIGKFLRKTSLDELPQIFNVLKGDMSLVGPRPYLPRELPEMGESKELIFLTRPGITGLWQVSGRNKLTFEQRLKLDSWYVLNWSLWLDVVILLKTIKVVLKREGAY